MHCQRTKNAQPHHRQSLASTFFCQLKKTGDPHFLTDFKEVNKCIQRKPSPLPRIKKSLQKIERFKRATAIDLSQGYYSIPLSKKSQKICTIMLPWGKYVYKRLIMGIACALDIFQSIMIDLLGNLDYVLVYVDDILLLQCQGESEGDYPIQIEVVLKQLNDIGFIANLCRSFFMKKEVEYLRFLLTTVGLKPQSKKVEIINIIKSAVNSKQLNRFLRLINFYQDLWPKRSHINFKF